MKTPTAALGGLLLLPTLPVGLRGRGEGLSRIGETARRSTDSTGVNGHTIRQEYQRGCSGGPAHGEQ